MSKTLINKFSKDCYMKFIISSLEKDKSSQPWTDFDFGYLFEKLEKEGNELQWELDTQNGPIVFIGDNALDRIMDECKDISNFAWFIYEKAKQIKNRRGKK
jgi:hypothetical protein|tara:strand:- start:801 stop:1103 length:303 start_codon:yes stop_codon:yes gene_type:complete